jgi:D12 class N6 adenine-specific DNA methyltransferase
MANYGIPYLGSKDSIVHKICSIFPKADHFYDLFGGGFSITHYMLMHRKQNYKKFYFNEIAPGVVDLIKDAIEGKFNYNVFKPKFVSREEFFKKKDSCAYTRIIWSFGNNLRSYLFGNHIEKYKKSMHNAVVFNDFDNTAIKTLGIGRFPKESSVRDRRLFVRIAVKKRNPTMPVSQLQQLRELQHLERVEQLQRLQGLEQLEQVPSLEFTQLDYRKVIIKPNSIIYCDPPYQNTARYLNSFNHDEFWKWVAENPYPVFVSEYSAPSFIKTLMAINKHTKLSPNGETKTKPEKIFGNDAAVAVMKKI